MSVNAFNSSHPPPHHHHHPPSYFSIYNFLSKCFRSTTGSLSISIFVITNIFFILPLCTFVLYLGHQRWRQQRSSAPLSHSDVFTYNMVITELINILGFTLSCCAVFTDLPEMVMTGVFLFTSNMCAQTFFHILTCVERYLAVVHPVTYVGLRKARGIRIRNITIGCAWLLSFLMPGSMFIDDSVSFAIFLCFTAFTLIIICFCSLSVLCVLIRPGPGEGEGGGSRQQVHQSKLRAFYTIMTILGVLLLRLGQNIVGTAVNALPQLGETGKCVVWSSAYWFSLPSSLVSPLLFLHRAGKLPCCKSNTES